MRRLGEYDIHNINYRTPKRATENAVPLVHNKRINNIKPFLSIFTRSLDS